MGPVRQAHPMIESLEPRLLLNVSLVPGEFTYFDISSAGANNDVPDPGDLFVGLGDGTTAGVSITLVESNLGNSAPTELRIQGTGGADTIELFFNASPGVVLNYSGGSYALSVHHESVTWNSASGSLSGNDSALSAGTYVAAGPGLASASADVVAGFSGNLPTFSLNRTAQGTLTQVSGQIVSHGTGDAGNFTTNAPVVNLTIDVNGSGSLAGALGNVSAPSWNGGGISADSIGSLTITTGDLVRRGWVEQWLEDFFPVIDRYDRVVFLPVLGNHDIGSGKKEYLRIFGMADYWFDYGNARFIVADNSGSGFSNDQLAWMENLLKTAGDKKIFVFAHKPVSYTHLTLPTN